MQTLADLAEDALIVLDVFEHVDHHRRPEHGLGGNIGDRALDRLHAIVRRVPIREDRRGVTTRLDGGHRAERREALRERAVPGADLEDRAERCGRARSTIQLR